MPKIPENKGVEKRRQIASHIFADNLEAIEKESIAPDLSGRGRSIPVVPFQRLIYEISLNIRSTSFHETFS